jgi:hypothetical protein
MTALPKQCPGDDATLGRLTPEVVAQLTELHARSTIMKGQGQVTGARREASRKLWEMVNQHYTDGVSSRELARVLGVQTQTITAQLRSHGFLGGPSPSQRRVRNAAGPHQHEPPSPRLAAAAEHARRANLRVEVAKAQAVAAREDLRQAVLAEHAAAHRPSSLLLSVQAGVGANTIRHWLKDAPPQRGFDHVRQSGSSTSPAECGAVEGDKE